MPDTLESIIKQFDYTLPQGLIAQYPANPRDAAKLLVYVKSSNQIFFDTFAHIGKYLPPNAVMVFNQTRVVPARLTAEKETGGKVKLLFLGQAGKLVKVLADRKLAIGGKLTVPATRGHKNRNQAGCSFSVVKQEENIYYLQPHFAGSRFMELLNHHGQTPLPPYIKHSPLSEKQKREKYQSVFAKTGISVAAPTASLHFTERLVNKIKKQGIDVAFVRLDVNLGTFAPLREEQINSGRLHSEFYNIDKSTAKLLNLAKAQGRPIIAVGTTVARTLESASIFCHHGNKKTQGGYKLGKLCGDTDLFIRENYKFKFVDGMVTNFHVPKSSLLMLVAALAGRQNLLRLYQDAIKHNFRFFSFGDGMLVLP
jgi:S-adenosylmethionine:tRNA ribosyltransferase-isomerase